MMKKKLLAMALSATMVLGMAGCGAGNDGRASTNADASTGSQTQTSSSAETKQEDTTEEPITLRMAWWGSQTRHDITTQVINMYMEEHPNVTIEYEFYSFDDYFTKLKLRRGA